MEENSKAMLALIPPSASSLLAWLTRAVLACPVCDVLKLRSDEQMLDIDAGRIVAAMENAHPGGDVSLLRYPRQAMRAAIPALYSKFGIARVIDAGPAKSTARQRLRDGIIFQPLFNGPRFGTFPVRLHAIV